MNRVLTTGQRLIAGLTLLLFTGSLLAQATSEKSYVKPGIDLSSYKKVMVRPLDIDNIEILKPVWEQDNDEVWTLELQNLKMIQELYMDAMLEQLEKKGGYALVADAGEDVLRMEVEVLSITPYVRPGTPGNDGHYKIQTLGSGDLVFSAEFRDSTTRELLALFEGERTIGDEFKKLSPENHIENLKNLFSKWGAYVRESLDAHQAKK